jgi:hypothetical protein
MIALQDAVQPLVSEAHGEELMPWEKQLSEDIRIVLLRKLNSCEIEFL